MIADTSLLIVALLPTFLILGACSLLGYRVLSNSASVILHCLQVLAIPLS
jgi:hypothetical protein